MSSTQSRLWHIGARPESAAPGPSARLVGDEVHTDMPDHRAANPARIARALAYATALPTGGWYAVEASARIGATPRAFDIAGREIIVWRDAHGLRGAPAACPHMGASLAGARVCAEGVVCPWHGLVLGPQGHGPWRPLAVHDDGVLSWVRLDDGEPATARPILAPRPTAAMAGVVRMEAACEPEDVLANRLDPWHGAHYHPHSFAALRVLEERVDRLTVRVSYRVIGPICVEVDATFHCPDARTIVMTIVAGEGRDSVVETHATPAAEGRTIVLEATLATSDRPGFARMLAWPGSRSVAARFIEARARRLWIEDVAYAQRLAQLRRRTKDALLRRPESA